MQQNQTPSNAFDLTLREINGGDSLSELSDGLTRLVAAVRATGRPGKLKYEIKVKPASKGETVALMIDDAIDLKLPQGDRRSSFFFATEENRLQRSDPRQREFQLKTVPPPPVEDLKQVAS